MPLDYASAAYEQMSPSLLSQQPVSAPPQVAGKDWNDIFTHLESRLGMMRAWRYSWWAYWAALARFILPERYHWLVVANRMSRGNQLNDEIIDGTATLAMKICAAGLWTGLTSPSRPWFKLGVALPWVKLDAEATEWIEDTESRVYTVMGQSNFYTIMAQAFRDVATFGTSPVIVYEDFEDVIRLYCPCAGEYYLDVGARLSVDTMYREFTLNVLQIVDQFTFEKCPEAVRKLWQTGGGSLQQEFVVAHAIEPNFSLGSRTDSSKRITVVPGQFEYREVYWLKGIKNDAELSRRGFKEKPFMVARWSTVSNDPYGRGPGMDALGDTKQIQQETRRKAEFIEKGVRPPMGANPELKNEPASILPANITYMNTEGGKKGFWPLFEPNPQWLGALVNDIEKVSMRIKDAFYVNIFMAISQMEGVQPRNELELTKRDLERLQVLGPFISLFETEFGDPAITRIYNILHRRNLLKPMPKSLQGIPLKIKYVSIMRLAQQAAEAVGLKDFIATGGAASSAAKAAGLPDPLRTVNLDKWYKRYAEATNVPEDVLFTEEEVQEHDAARAKVQQAQQGMTATAPMVDAAKTLSETKLGGGTALGAILGNGATPSPGAPQ